MQLGLLLMCGRARNDEVKSTWMKLKIKHEHINQVYSQGKTHSKLNVFIIWKKATCRLTFIAYTFKWRSISLNNLFDESPSTGWLGFHLPKSTRSLLTRLYNLYLIQHRIYRFQLRPRRRSLTVVIYARRAREGSIVRGDLSKLISSRWSQRERDNSV